MTLELAKAILVLPGTVLVCVPAAILWGSSGTYYKAAIAAIAEGRIWAGAVVFASGFVFALWTMRLLVDKGRGTRARRAPLRGFVVRQVQLRAADWIAHAAFWPPDTVSRRQPTLGKSLGRKSSAGSTRALPPMLAAA